MLFQVFSLLTNTGGQSVSIRLTRLILRCMVAFQFLCITVLGLFR